MDRRRSRSAPFALLLVVAVTAFGTVAEAAKRVALLIGNANYESTAALKNPANDVALLKKTLEDAGFDSVTVAIDLDLVEMRKALRAFEDAAYDSDVAVLYYSGHGMEMGGQNYLIPTDARLASDKDVEDETLPLDRAQRALDGAKKLKLIILDACRNNPFLESMSRTVGGRAIQKGLAKVEPQGADTLIAYASKAGTVALDGTGGNSPFATALAKYITQPGVDVRIALGQVRDEVVKMTANNQEPFLYGSLGGTQIFLNIKELNVTVNTPSDKKDEGQKPDISDAATDWQNIRDLADRDLLEAFIKKHGNDPVYKMLAEKKLKQLTEQEAKIDFSPEDIAWEALKGSSDAAAIKRYLERYPNSAHKAEAEAQLAALVPDTHTTQTGDLKDSPSARDCYLLAGEPDPKNGFAGVALEAIDAARAKTACQTATKEHPKDGTLFNNLGRAKQRAGDFAGARADFETAADLGNLNALVNLAWFAIDGLDGPKDVLKGKGMLEKAAKAGSADAQAALARLYRDGADGIPQDYAEALKWYSQAANQGNVLALSNLGWFYRDGLGVATDYVKSIDYYQKAADAGDPTSMAAMGYAAQNGLGMPQDYAKAAEWYKKGAEADDAYSMASLGYLYDAGQGVQQDYVEARYWYEKAAYKKDSFAMASLSRLHDQGLGTRVDAKEAVRWAMLAVESGEKAKLEEMKSRPDNFTPAFRRELQQALKERGLYTGPVTGNFDDPTFAALDALMAGTKPDQPSNDDQAQDDTNQTPDDDGQSTDDNGQTPDDTQNNTTDTDLGGGGGGANSADTDAQTDDTSNGTTTTTTAGEWVLTPNRKSQTAAARECYTLAGEPGSEPDFEGVLFGEIRQDKALAACNRAIAEDSTDSMLYDMLGRIYDVKLDYVRAKANYERALSMGNSHALANLAWMAIYGNGEPKDIDKGMRMMTAAAEAGNAYAQSSLGWLHREGFGGVRKDYRLAYDWYLKAAEQGYANAEASLGYLYREGLGVDKDVRTAFEWYLKGAEHGDLNAMGSVGYAYQNGEGTSVNFEEAFFWYQKAADRNDAYSMASLAWLYENGNGVGKDLAKAKYWYETAAGLGNTYAMGNLAYLFDQGTGTPRNISEAGRLAMAAMEGKETPFIDEMKNGATRFSSDFRKEVQRRLADLGFYDGKLDGKFGPGVSDAIDRLVNR